MRCEVLNVFYGKMSCLLQCSHAGTTSCNNYMCILGVLAKKEKNAISLEKNNSVPPYH